MSEIKRLYIGKRYSQCSIHNGTVYLAGQVAQNTKAEIKAQTVEVLASIDKFLIEAGTNKGRILMAQIFLADISDYSAMNEVWDAWVAKENPPSRATVQAKLSHFDEKIEIVVTAAL